MPLPVLRSKLGSPLPGPRPQLQPQTAAPGVVPVQWPSFTGVATFVGKDPTSHVSVWTGPGVDGATAQTFLGQVGPVATINNVIFNRINFNPCNVLIWALGGYTDGSGGAIHAACNFMTGGAIEIDYVATVSSTTSLAPRGKVRVAPLPHLSGTPVAASNLRELALFEAEYAECCMGGAMCGQSQGEALSRWCGMVVSNNALSDFESGTTWLAAGHPDWVTQNETTDQDYISIGCGMIFISWMLSLGYSFPVIAQTLVAGMDGGTFAQLYETLTGDSAGNAYPKFIAALQLLKSAAIAANPDDPFNQLGQVMRSLGG